MIRVLVVDGCPATRRGVRHILEQSALCAVCGEAGDGVDALSIARQLRPDVILVDAAILHPDGVTMARQLQANLPAARLLLFGTESGTAGEAFAALKGFHGYVPKASPPEDIVAALESLAPYPNPPAPPAGRGLSALTPRERQVVALVAQGERTREVATHLGISEKTVESHRAAVMRKLNLRTLAELVRFAIRSHIIEA